MEYIIGILAGSVVGFISAWLLVYWRIKYCAKKLYTSSSEFYRLYIGYVKNPIISRCANCGREDGVFLKIRLSTELESFIITLCLDCFENKTNKDSPVVQSWALDNNILAYFLWVDGKKYRRSGIDVNRKLRVKKII